MPGSLCKVPMSAVIARSISFTQKYASVVQYLPPNYMVMYMHAQPMLRIIVIVGIC